MSSYTNCTISFFSTLWIKPKERWREKETYRVRRVLWSNAGAVKEEANGGNLLALALTESIHQLLQLGGPLDLEEDFVVVVGHLDVEVLGLAGRASLFSFFGHFG